MSATFDFSDKQVFIFGGTSGINLGIARCFASAGARVAVASRSQDKVDAAVAELEKLGAQADGYSLDVRDSDAVEAALSAQAEKAGALDVLVSGAAGNFPALAHKMSPNAFKSVVDIDLLGSFHVLRAAFPHLKKPGASVINISAPQAFIAMKSRTTAVWVTLSCVVLAAFFVYRSDEINDIPATAVDDAARGPPAGLKAPRVVVTETHPGAVFVDIEEKALDHERIDAFLAARPVAAYRVVSANAAVLRSYIRSASDQYSFGLLFLGSPRMEFGFSTRDRMNVGGFV